MKTLHTKFFGATNTKGSRIRVTDNDGFTKFYSYNHSVSCPHIWSLKQAKKIWLDGTVKDKKMVVGGTKNCSKIAVFADDEII